jgi:hypothetical protein
MSVATFATGLVILQENVQRKKIANANAEANEDDRDLHRERLEDNQSQ